MTAEIFEKYIDSNTKLIVLATVQEINGYRADLKSICDMAHRHGCFVLADGIQEVGAMQVDVKTSGVDFYCAGGKKWLGNPFGMGFLYVRKDLIEKFSPAYDSYFNVSLPAGYDDYMSYLENPSRTPFDDCPVVQTAMKYEIGAYKNYIGAMGLARAIDVLLDVGTDNIEKHILMLNRRLTKALKELGVSVCSSEKAANMSPSVCFNFGLKGGKSLKEKKLERYLFAQNIFVSLRCSSGVGGIRVSMHYYTRTEEVDALLEAVKRWIEEAQTAVGQYNGEQRTV
jgi:selenocysteine lyase/cysteine desulfurase